MLKNKLLEDIEPFNEVFYRDCFYNSLFPVIKYFKRDVLTFLINDVVAYKEDNKTSKLNFNAEYMSIHSFERICCGESLIKVECKTKSDDLVKDIVDSISKGRPVILFIDCYYKNAKPKTYSKEHWFHTITIFGYDLDSEIFDVIEHKYRDNLGYEKSKMGFSELKKCNEGYIQNFLDELKRDSYYSFYLDEKSSNVYQPKDKKLLSNMFKNNVLLKKDEINEGINRLQEFAKEFEKIVSNEKDLRRNAQDIVSVTSNIINCKKVERYKLENIMDTEYEILNLVDAVVEEWSQIRRVIAKYLFSQIYKPNDINRTVNSINEIVELENLYISRF